MRSQARSRSGWHGRGSKKGDALHDEWLGGEALLSLRQGRTPWREVLRSREGFSGLALGLALAAGIFIGGGWAVLQWTRRR